MKYFQRTSKEKRTFAQRLGRSAIYWGVPVMLLQLVGIPKRLWIPILVISIPATMVGVLIDALTEHGVVSYLGGKRPGSHDTLGRGDGTGPATDGAK